MDNGPEPHHEVRDLINRYGEELNESPVFDRWLQAALDSLGDSILDIDLFRDSYYMHLVAVFQRRHEAGEPDGSPGQTALSMITPQPAFWRLSAAAIHGLIGELEQHGIVCRVRTREPTQDPRWLYCPDPFLPQPPGEGVDPRLLPLLQDLQSDVSQDDLQSPD